jgi:hypothetical protein
MPTEYIVPCPMWVSKTEELSTSKCRPLFPQERTSWDRRLEIAFRHHKLTSRAIDKALIFSATFGDTELFLFAVDCTRAMNLVLDNLQSTARGSTPLLSWHARDAHLQLTANRIVVARDNGRLSRVRLAIA